ncbi:helix-turn-helix domain-containing protein [Streptomyces mauvecolor]
MSAAHQWVSTTTGRIATCPYSWLQAVHWVAGSGLYTPSRRHGPKWGPTTIALAQELSALSECRPGIGYLSRKLGVSERTVQYHLGMLREAGLLAYRSKGTRLAGSLRQASHFERIIPVAFDTALGIRTVQSDGAPAVERRPVGIAEEAREVMAKLARTAARKVRRKRSRGRGRCTPMQGGTSSPSTAGTTVLPPESKLDDGTKDAPAAKKQQKQARQLNKIGRRHQLARELITEVSWLAPASSPRIAWIVRHVADAGWSCHQVRAFLSLGGEPAAARRPSGMLAHRLKGAEKLWDTEAKRVTATQAWQDSQLSRKQTSKGFDGPWGQPCRVSVQRLMAEAAARVRQLDTAAATVIDLADEPAVDALESLTREEIVDMRAAAMKDPTLILTTIDLAGEDYARRLYTNQLVDQALTSYAPTTVITW